MMLDLATKSKFRAKAYALETGQAWVKPAHQKKSLYAVCDRVSYLQSKEKRAIVCIDLDLTTLNAPLKSREVVATLRQRASDIANQINENEVALKAHYVQILELVWSEAIPSLLPGYTTTAIEGYALYLIAQLERITTQALCDDSRDRCEKWVNDQVFQLLRNAYWDRDAVDDEITSGAVDWIEQVAKLGGEIVFLSNRPTSVLNASLEKIVVMCKGNMPIFVFFGPGGSAFDALSKSTAVTILEEGCEPGIYKAKSDTGKLYYQVNRSTNSAAAIVAAVIDDRAQNRNQVLAAATRSSTYWKSTRFSGIANVAVAATGFCPEIAIIDSALSVSSFE